MWCNYKGIILLTQQLSGFINKYITKNTHLVTAPIQVSCLSSAFIEGGRERVMEEGEKNTFN